MSFFSCQVGIILWRQLYFYTQILCLCACICETQVLCINISSYFEKACRKKCTRQSRKVLWVVLSSLFFKEIWKNGTRGRGRMFARTKEKQQKSFWQLQCQEQCIDHISYYLSGLSRAHFCRQPFSMYWWLIRVTRQPWKISFKTFAYYRPLPNETLRTNAIDDVYSLGSFILSCVKFRWNLSVCSTSVFLGKILNLKNDTLHVQFSWTRVVFIRS